MIVCPITILINRPFLFLGLSLSCRPNKIGHCHCHFLKLLIFKVQNEDPPPSKSKVDNDE
jgi:hypothetical protein